MEYILLLLLAAVIALQIVLLFHKPKEHGQAHIKHALEEAVQNIRTHITQEHLHLRQELDGKLDLLKNTQQTTIHEFRKEQLTLLGDFRKEQLESGRHFSESTANSMEQMRTQLNERLEKTQGGVDERLEKIRTGVDERLEKVRLELEKALGTLQHSNEKKLEEMRLVVNEKLEKTLETRLQKSFETVSTQLESVNKGLGEMKNVAESVGSLNRMLGGSKSRGILGELQLGQIIEDMLPPQLYEKEVCVKKRSNERVEYAVKLPGTKEGERIYLPIDSKFPLDDYVRLLDGYDEGNVAKAEEARKALQMRIKAFAKDVKEKYIAPPETTNFAVIFLPTEGLYAEIARDVVFFESLRKMGIIITGPTTLSAMLNALQVGFKTLQIQKSASDIEKILGAAKKEFETFETVLVKAHDKIKQAGSDIDKLVGVRTRAINRSLRDVQTYTGEDSAQILDTQMP